MVAASRTNSPAGAAIGPDTADRLDRAVERMRLAADVDELIDILRANARRLIGADGIAIILRDGGSCHYVEEDAISPLWKGGRFPLETCVSGWAMLNGRTAVIPDILCDPRVPKEAYRRTFVRSMAMAPMSRRNAGGALGAYWAQLHTPDPAEVMILECLAEAAGKALGRLAEPNHEPLVSSSRLSGRKRGWLQRFDARKLMLDLLPEQTLPFWQGQLVALGLTFLSALLRHFGTPYIGSTAVFTAFFPAILISSLWGGPSAAATTTVLSTVAGAAISYSIGASGVGWIMFVFVAAAVGLVACSVRAALDLQHIRAGALEDRDRELASISRELDHRSKNTLAVVSALTRQAAQASVTKEEMRDRLCNYFATMGAAQTLLVEVGARGLLVKQILEEALAPFIAEERIRIDIDPTLKAPGGNEVMLSLAFSELATNSCKYGALSMPDGEVHIAGSRAEGEIRLEWTESGGGRVEAPSLASTGTRLISRTLASIPGARVKPSFHPAGFRCEFAWPVGA